VCASVSNEFHSDRVCFFLDQALQWCTEYASVGAPGQDYCRRKACLAWLVKDQMDESAYMEMTEGEVF
jgi:hypothetical protein